MAHYRDDRVSLKGEVREQTGRIPESVSVVIPAYNEARWISQQLDALARQTYAGPWEVIVADNGSTDGTQRVVQDRMATMPQLRLVDASEIVGAGHARNVGSAAAVGDLLLYCDADDMVADGWLEAMVDVARVSDLFAGRREFETLNDPRDRSLLTAFDEPRPDSPHFRFLPWASSANLGIWRDALEVSGGWNTAYRFSQDVEFCWRVQLHGFSYDYAPASLVHQRNRSDGRAYLRQRWNWAVFAPKLYLDFRDHGLTRQRPREILRAWVWIITRAPYLVLSRRRRRLWLTLTVERFGRLWGSCRWKVWCP